MDRILHRDWNSFRDPYPHFVDERDIHNCVIEKIIRNKFWDPMISSDEEGPPSPINWDTVFGKKSFIQKKGSYQNHVPGLCNTPMYPKLSALTQKEHLQCIKVLSAKYKSILPKMLLGKPTNEDRRLLEEKMDVYMKEQEEYREWAKDLWASTNCVRTLHPKPALERVYKAESMMRSFMVQSFPKSYMLAAQIPLKADGHTCQIILPKMDLVKVDISKLPTVEYPDIYNAKENILRQPQLPSPCPLHPCKFLLPNEREVSILPLTEVHKELAQYAFEQGAGLVASEGALRCLLEVDHTWSLPLSVCEVIGPDGDITTIIVLASEFPEKPAPAPVRAYRAYRRLLYDAFTTKSSTSNTLPELSDSSGRILRSQQGSNKATTRNTYHVPPVKTRRLSTEAHQPAATDNQDSSDSDDDNRLQIVIDEESQNGSELDSANNTSNSFNQTNEQISSLDSENQPRKILKAARSTLNRNSESENTMTNIDSPVTNHIDSNQSNNIDHIPSSTVVSSSSQSEEQQAVSEPTDIELCKCICKGTEFEMPPARSFKKLTLKNNTTNHQINVIVHTAHKAKSAACREVVLEPIVEYQLDVGASLQSQHKIHSLAFSLMLRKNADLTNVRVDGVCGDVVTMDTTDLRRLGAQHGDLKPHVANTLYTALGQLVGLLPGSYILKHEPAHGSNALLYCRAGDDPGAECVPLQGAAPAPAEEARLALHAPRLAPVLLPIHKYRRHLPLAFTYNQYHVAKETNKKFVKTLPVAYAAADNEGSDKWRNNIGKRKKKKKKNKNSETAED